MFTWLRDDGLREVEEVVLQLLGDDRHVLDLAMAARVGGKNAERIGDLSKGLFGIAETVGAPPPGEIPDEMIALLDEEGLPRPAASGLSFRHLARIVANLLNITSAVVMPLDQLDYPSEHVEEDGR